MKPVTPPALAVENEQLKAALEDVQFRLGELTGATQAPVIVWPGYDPVPVARQWFTLWSVLSARRGEIVSREALHTALCGTRPDADWPEMEGIDVMLARLRKAIAPLPVMIVNCWGSGWRLIRERRVYVRVGPLTDATAQT